MTEPDRPSSTWFGRWWRRKWYWVIGLGLIWSAPTLVACLIFLQEVYSIPVHAVPDGVLLVCFCVIVLLSILWTCWMCPFMNAANPHAIIVNPVKFRKSLRFGPWTLVWVCAVFMIAPLLPLLHDRYYEGRWERLSSNDLIYMLVWGLFLMLLLPWTLWLVKRIDRRFLAEIRRRQLCLQCGYDLRGNPAATSCPECGAAIER